MKLSLLLFALQLFCLVSYVSAGSDGKNVGICNVYGPYGCPEEEFPVDRDGNLERKFCKVKSSRTMHWALAGTRTNNYRLYVDDEKTPTKAYIPEKLHYISIRVTKVRWNYRGFLIYVNDAKNATVGEFVLPKDDSPTYSRLGEICQGSVTHAMADEKPIVMTFAWRAPAAGAGPVTVRALLKRGDANTGAFHWPNEEGDFVMSEGKAAAAAVEYRTAPPGVDCNKICADNCDEEATKNIAKSEVESIAFKRTAYCKLPYLLDCKEASGSIDPESFCLYRDATCPAVTTPACGVKSGTHDRVCACKGNAPPPPKTLYTQPPATLYPKSCETGDTTCHCLPNGLCTRSSDVCIGHQVCPADADASCVNFAGVCVKPECAGEENCECKQGRCFSGLVCNGGACEGYLSESMIPDFNLTFKRNLLFFRGLLDFKRTKTGFEEPLTGVNPLSGSSNPVLVL